MSSYYSNLRCRKCGFSAPEEEFASGRCPQCNARVRKPGRTLGVGWGCAGLILTLIFPILAIIPCLLAALKGDDKSTRVMGWVGFGLNLAVLATLLVVGLRGYVYRLSPAGKLETAARAACTGTPIQDASAYTAGPGIHPIYIVHLDTSQDSISKKEYPEGWWAGSTGAVQLVACITNDTRLVETCHYVPGGRIERFQYTASLQVIVAGSGEVIHTVTLSGGDPAKCPSSATFGETSDSNTIYGSQVTSSQILNSLVSIVNP